MQGGLTEVLRASTNQWIYGNSSSITRSYVHEPRGLGAYYLEKSGMAYAGFIPRWMDTLEDGLGSIRAEINHNSQVIAGTRTMNPYGDVMTDYNYGTMDSGYGFTGEQIDPNELVYLRARYYDPNVGVFASLDPFEGKTYTPMSLNGYSWVEGNVANWSDASGLTRQLAELLNYASCNQSLQNYLLQDEECLSLSMQSALTPELFLYPRNPPRPAVNPMGEHGSLGNRLLLRVMYWLVYETYFTLGADAMDVVGLNIAASNMRHYLSGTGEDVIINVDDLLSDVPYLQELVNSKFTEVAMPVIEDAARNNYNADFPCNHFHFEPSFFNGVEGMANGWLLADAYAGENSRDAIADWFYGVGRFSYGFSGGVSITALSDRSFALDLCYVVNVYDRYDWHPKLSVDIGPFTIPDRDPGVLHLLGEAREFDIFGVSSLVCLPRQVITMN